MSEKDLQNQMRIALSQPGTRLFKNTVGMLYDKQGRAVRVGLGVGTSDLIGLTCVRITPAMVGTFVAVFCAVEVKLPDNSERPEPQKNFISLVRELGGFAGFADTIESAQRILSP